MYKKIYKILSLTSAIILFLVSNIYGQVEDLKWKINKVIEGKKAKIGISVTNLNNIADSVTINGDEHFPMLSVYKFHLALYVLSKIDDGVFSLDQVIPVKEEELLPNTFSRLKEENPVGGIEVSLRQLLTYSISHSDNNACDILFKLVKGTEPVNTWIKNQGVKDVSILYTEDEMHRDARTFYQNWTTPVATNKLLKLFYDKKILSATNTDFLWQLMVNTSVGNDRIKGFLRDELVGHRPGTAGMNSQGINPGYNDIGIVSLSKGQGFAISVFISASRETDAENARIIAEIANLAADHFASKTQR